jgi:hypothetical protein
MQIAVIARDRNVIAVIGEQVRFSARALRIDGCARKSQNRQQGNNKQQEVRNGREQRKRK